MSIASQLAQVKATLPAGVELIAVSKTHPSEVVMEAYEAGQRVFGENPPRRWLRNMSNCPRISSGI